MSLRHPEIRAQELSGTSVPTKFDVVWYRPVRDPRAAERAAHEKLSYCRESKNREFFRIDVRSAVMQLDRIAERYEAESALAQIGLDLEQFTKALSSSAQATIEFVFALVTGVAYMAFAAGAFVSRISSTVGRAYWNALPSMLGSTSKALLTLSLIIFLTAMAILLSDLFSGNL